MVDYLTSIVIMALVARGAFVAMGEGMVLEALSKLIARLPLMARKPLGTCSYCMVSAWGTATLAFLSALPPLYVLPVLWLCSAGLLAIFDR